VFLWVGAGFIGTASAQAQTELQKFKSTLPPGANLAFVNYESCSLLAASNTRQAARERGQTASFEQIEAAIAETCMTKLLTDPQWTLLRMSPAERAKLIERFSALALVERRLNYEGKPIPGFRMDRWVAEVMKCTDRKVLKALDDCIIEQAKPLIQSSTESPEAIALAVDGACQGAQDKVVGSSRNAWALKRPGRPCANASKIGLPV